MPDRIVEIEGGRLQHGRENDRVYIMSLEPERAAAVVEAAEALAQEHGYSKIFAKVSACCRDFLRARDYLEEASIPSLGQGAEKIGEVVFMSRFLNDRRACDHDREERLRILHLAEEKAAASREQDGADKLPEGFVWRVCDKSACGAMAGLYRRVFASYPFPIHDPQYLAETMDTHVIYFGVWESAGGRLAALSSAETDRAKGMVEMTDFATDPEYRGQGFGVFLLRRMEESMREHKLPVAYTIARAISPGMNIVFAKLGYRYGGTLINNTDICGRLESMNIWHKHLA